MKFILNTSLDPHFCAIFDTNNILIDYLEWTDRRRTGEIVWNFLEKNKISEKKINFIGGISGPGGFSNLRGTSGILNALSLKFNIPVHQVRADVFVKKFLEKNNYFKTEFLLNSFSDGVFFCDKDNELVRTTIRDIVKKYQKKEVFVEFLPKEKKEEFQNKINLKLKDLAGILLKTLEQTKSQKQFIPNYEFPAV